ncbi:MAG: FAD/NAD(P)-binding protein [bacterium]
MSTASEPASAATVAENIYRPKLLRIAAIADEAPAVRTLRLEFTDPHDAADFAFRTGQFGEYSVFGAGESPFCIASPATRTEYIECTFREAGRVTRALAKCEVGETIGFRGPYGNHFPVDEWEGKTLVFIAGGIGLPPVRSVIWTCLDQRERFDDVTIIYGARTEADLVYKRELAEWEKRDDVRMVQTVDPGGESPDWTGHVGFVPAIVEKAELPTADAVAVVCGPPIMIKFTLATLSQMHFPLDRVYTTLENRMKCGLGKCGRCNVGPVYVCKEGPVLTAARLAELPMDY